MLNMNKFLSWTSQVLNQYYVENIPPCISMFSKRKGKENKHLFIGLRVDNQRPKTLIK